MSAEKRLAWWSSPRELLRSILMLDDTRHSIALGTAIGMFVALTPTGGVQMLLVLALSLTVGRFFRFNRLAALITVYVSNPLTMVPICWFEYRVGTLFKGGNWTRHDFQRILQYDGFDAWYQTIVKLFVEIGTPLILGSLIVAATSAALTYPLMLALQNAVRSPNLRRQRRRHKFKKAVSPIV
jgi:uncharacterized protein (DUF2062 family)